MKKILFNKIILSIFFFLSGAAIAWTQGPPSPPAKAVWLPPSSPLVAKTTVKTVTGLDHREDENYVYYDIDLGPGNEGQKLDVKVNNGQVTVTGSIQRTEESESYQSFFGSSFENSFPLPSDVDEHSFVTEYNGNKLIIKFKKIQQT